MTHTSTLKITTPSDREIAMTRVFDAPRDLVFDALTKCELVKRWLGVFGDWSVAECTIDLKVGGRYRYVWRNAANGQQMGVGGEYREIAHPGRIVHTERFDEAWYPGESLITTTLDEQAGRTTMVATILYESKEARDGVLASGMAQGVEASYDRLAEELRKLA
jgi:uncharacterized protein YndB with AHSA1/START domain